MTFLGVDWGKLSTINFWIETNPGSLSTGFERFFLVVLIVSYLLFGLSKLMQKKLSSTKSYIKAKFWQKVSTFCLSMAIIFTFIFFFRYEAIPVLGGRFWILIWLLIGLGWLVYLIRYWIVNVPQQLEELKEKQVYNKYLQQTKNNKKKKRK